MLAPNNIAVLMLRTELRLRFRRNSTWMTMLAVMLVVWFTILDPRSGYALLAANTARVAYNSTGLALGSSVIATMLLSLFGFYLVRGRVDEDLHAGLGHVIGATPMHNGGLLLVRWAGSVAYLSALIIALSLTMFVLQAVRGEGGVEPAVFLQFYLLTIVPNIFFIAAMATLCDAHERLMGKLGDVLYFMFWLAQMTAGAVFVSTHPDTVSLLVFDPSGMGVLTQRGQMLLHTQGLAVGLNAFDKALAPVILGHGFWTWPMILTRFAALSMAGMPLALAVSFFHRFSPDRVAASRSRKSWAIGAGVNRLFKPFDIVSRLLFILASRVPQPAARVGAELALTFAANRLAGPLFVAAIGAGTLLDNAALPALLLAGLLYWGVLIADVCVRDFTADTEQLRGAVAGAVQTYWRQCITTVLLGFLLTAPVMVRWGRHQPVKALAVAAAIVALTGLAQLLGRGTRTARCFTVVFLFGLYLATQAGDVVVLDLLGLQTVAAVVLLAAGHGLARRL